VIRWESSSGRIGLQLRCVLPASLPFTRTTSGRIASEAPGCSGHRAVSGYRRPTPGSRRTLGRTNHFRTPAPATIPAALPPPGGNRRAPTGPSHVALNESAVCRRPWRSPFNSAASPASPSLASIAADETAQRGPNRPPHPSRSPHLSNRELRAKSATRRPFFVGVCSRTIRLDRCPDAPGSEVLCGYLRVGLRELGARPGNKPEGTARN
jgi:hypothetical protein